LVRFTAAVIAVGVVIGLLLLVAPPTLPSERERTAAAPPASTPTRAGDRPASGAAPPATQPSTTTLPATTPATTPTPQPARRHTIRAGDTLLAIAEQYDTTVDAIRAANPGLSETALRVGQEIAIPASR